jgi:hypothetical protein
MSATIRLPQPRAVAFDERQARAAAGITLVIGAVAFSYAYFDKRYAPLQAVTAFFLVEFLLRVTLGLRWSPVGALAGAMTSRGDPEWVAARPKRFAWTLGLVMAAAMTAITNSGVRGLLPRTICLVCLALMWLEAVLGLCVGCKLAVLLARRGWLGGDLDGCATGSCDVRLEEPC